MIMNTPRLQEFYRKLMAEENLSHEEALRIYEALHAEAVYLGAISHENILEGLEVDLRIARAVNGLKTCSYPVKFATREDIIIHKMVAGRAIDEEDIKSILVKSKGAIDLEYIRRWLLQFAEMPEHSRILDRLNDLLSQ